MNLKETLANLLSYDVTSELKAVLLSELKPELISAENLVFFRNYILEKSVKINLNGLETIDICGTGGDGKDTINISTAAAFLISACGFKVTKHGNFGFSSQCGSSDILFSLGVKLPESPLAVLETLEQYDLAFIHAPYFHPGLKNLGPIRKAIKIKTIFNILGPLCNPANPSASFLGVADYSILRLYQFVLGHSKNKYFIGYDQNGYDECSLTGKYYLVSNESEDYFGPDSFIKDKLSASDLVAHGNLDERKNIFLKILSGKSSNSHNDVVSINAALAISLVDKSRTIEEIFKDCRKVLLSGYALNQLKKLLNK